MGWLLSAFCLGPGYSAPMSWMNLQSCRNFRLLVAVAESSGPVARKNQLREGKVVSLGIRGFYTFQVVGLGISETSTVVHLPKSRSGLDFLTKLYNLVGPTSPQVTGSHAIQLGISSFIATINIQLLHNHRTVKHNISNITLSSYPILFY